MITKNIVKQPKAQVEVQISVPWVDMQNTWNQTLTQMAAELELPGFRKGQVPMPMAEQSLGKKLEDEVLKVVMPNALIEALNGTNIVPIDYPAYQVVQFQKGGELRFIAKITERPTISVGNYKTLTVPKPNIKSVTEEEVNNVVQELFKRWQLRNPQSNQASSQSTTQPAGQPQPQVAGSMSFNTNSASAPAPSQQSVAQTPDDQFAKAVGAADMSDLKIKIKQDLENEARYNAELDYEEAILQGIEKITTVDVPEILVQDELNRMLVSLQRNVTERGLLLDEYLKSQNKTVESLKSEWRPQAEKNVRMELGLSEVAKLEGVNITDDELQAEIDKIQDQRVKAQFTQDEPKMHLRHALRQTKTLNLLKGLVG